MAIICPVPGFNIPIDVAICAMSAIWFIIMSCSIKGFGLMAISMPFWNGIIMLGSGVLPFVTASIRAWISSLRAKVAFPFLPPTLSSKLRPVELLCIARGPVGRSVLRAFEGP